MHYSGLADYCIKQKNTFTSIDYFRDNFICILLGAGWDAALFLAVWMTA